MRRVEIFQKVSVPLSYFKIGNIKVSRNLETIFNFRRNVVGFLIINIYFIMDFKLKHARRIKIFKKILKNHFFKSNIEHIEHPEYLR